MYRVIILYLYINKFNFIRLYNQSLGNFITTPYFFLHNSHAYLHRSDDRVHTILVAAFLPVIYIYILDFFIYFFASSKSKNFLNLYFKCVLFRRSSVFQYNFVLFPVYFF